MSFIHRTRCPICEAEETTDLCRLPFTKDPVLGFLTQKYRHAVGEFHMLEGADYVLAECASCRAIFQRAAPDEDLLTTVYERWAENPVDGFAVSRRNRGVAFFTKHADQIIDILAFLDRNPYELRVFDFAFGWGHWCRLVQGFGCTVYGTEFSEKRRDCARAIGITVVPSTEIARHQFDWINANQVFEHLAEPLQTLRQLAPALAPGGIVTLGVPGARRLKQKIAQGDWPTVFGPLMPLEHLNYFPRGGLARMARQVGLVPVRIPERFVGRTGPYASRQNVKAVLRILGAPVTNNLFHCFAQPATDGRSHARRSSASQSSPAPSSAVSLP